jgi:branched-chain amino acid transport system substrate-binding protein
VEPEIATSVLTPATVPLPAGNGRLKIGVLLPTTGSGAQLGGPMINAVRLAVEEINRSGGVLGEPIEVVEVDEGGSVSSAGLGFDTLISQDVDAIVGPASSLAVLGELDAAVSAGVLTCSPTATAMSLDEFPDNGLFFRTVPSDSLQALAIARVAEQTGATNIAIGHLDDAYGRNLADAVERSLGTLGLRVGLRRAVARGESDLSSHAAALIEQDPGVLIILGDADASTRLLAAVGEFLGAGNAPRTIVNDAVRAARSSQILVDLPAALRQQVVGVAPLAIAADREDLTGPYAAHAYDCVKLIALATERAGTDAPGRIATQMAAVSQGGSVCRRFESCVERLREGLQIHYTGPSGSLELSSRTGDPKRSRFEQFTFDEDGRDVSGSWFDVSSS